MKLCLFALSVGLVLTLSVGGPAVEKDKHKEVHSGHQHQVADKHFLQKEKDILRLFKYVNQPSYYEDFVKIGNTYDILQNIQGYSRPEVVKYFVSYYKYSFIPRGAIFSIYYEEHQKQAEALFKLFFYAKDYETFFKTAVWARQNVNEGLFLYSVSLAFLYRPDCAGVVLPPIYEVYPYYFYSSDVVQQAYDFKQQYYGVKGVQHQSGGHKGQEHQQGAGGHGQSPVEHHQKPVGHQQGLSGHQQGPVGHQQVSGGHQHQEGSIGHQRSLRNGPQSQHGEKHESQHQDVSDYDGYTIFANYSGYYLNLHPEQSLSYYLEDVGLNSFYYYYSLLYPYWVNSTEYGFQWGAQNVRRGEMFYFISQQILARYYLERLSNGFGDIPSFEWDVPFETGYSPSLRYPNGLEFPSRPNYASLKEYFYNYGQKWCFKGKYGYSYTYVQDYERRIRDVLDRGYVFNRSSGKKIDLYSPEGFSAFGDLLQSNGDSPNPRFYGPLEIYARHLLGYSKQPLDQYRLAPSALEHPETSLRDPAFYQLYKRIVLYFQRYKSYLSPYSEKQLLFPGVEFEKVEFDKLQTYFEYFFADISNVAYYTEAEFENESFKVRAQQYRLNYKPFTYKVYLKAQQAAKTIVKVYIGPKYDEFEREIPIDENRVNFVQFDEFTYDLKSGENVIERSSEDGYLYCGDRSSYKQLYEHVLKAEKGQGEFYLGESSSYLCFPKRFRLPKGTFDGQDYQFYFIASPYVTDKEYQESEHGDYLVKHGGHHEHSGKQDHSSSLHGYDSYPLGYPLDRPIYEPVFYNVPNSYFYDAKIYLERSPEIKHIHH